jgi:hypothetical protein
MEIKSRDLHEKSRDLSNYEIFQHKILKSQILKKSRILVFLCHAEHLFSTKTVLKIKYIYSFVLQCLE